MKVRPLSPRRPAFSLIEVLMVMAALTVALGMLVVVLGGALRLEKASSGALARLLAQRELADQFRADVAGAADAPERWQEEAAGPACLILRLGKDRHVVYRWEAERLVRSEVVGEREQRRELALGAGPVAVEFARDRPGGRLMTLRVFTTRKDGGKQLSAEITAALGGDLQ
jgi:hypothetical protein